MEQRLMAVLSPSLLAPRRLDHYSRVVQRGESDDLVSLLPEQAKLLGIVRRQWKAHCERQQRESSFGATLS
jgi:hypothetical protein